MSKPRKPKVVKGNWVVRVRCTVIKAIRCEDCTEDEAREDPFDHAVDETEVSQEDWEIESVEPEST